MKLKLSPEDLQNQDDFELLTEVSHQNLREFVLEQVAARNTIIRIYSIYQILMVLLFTYFFTRAIILAIKGGYEMIIFVAAGIVFSLSLLIIIHELIHALGYLITGARKISFGAIPKKFVFYAMADRQVIAPGAFYIVALAPLVLVKLACLAGIIFYFDHHLIYFFLTVMCLHSLFCAGDTAMLAFYQKHKGKEIYNYDDKNKGKTYFYCRKSRT